MTDKLPDEIWFEFDQDGLPCAYDQFEAGTSLYLRADLVHRPEVPREVVEPFKLIEEKYDELRHFHEENELTVWGEGRFHGVKFCYDAIIAHITSRAEDL